MISEEIKDMLSSSDEEMIYLGITLSIARDIPTDEIMEIFSEINKNGYLYTSPNMDLRYSPYMEYERDFVIRTGRGGMNLLNKLLKDI